MRELEFRANFLAKILQNMIWVTWFIVVLMVVYRNTSNVAGWGRGEGFVLGATTFLLSAVFGLFFRAMLEIPEQVRRGNLDFILTKPVDSQFWASTRRFNFDQIGSLTAGVLMMWYGLSQTVHGADALQWAGFGACLFCSLALFYSMNLILMSTSVWFVRVDNLWVLSETSLDVSRFPVDIFGVGVQKALTYVVPIAFLSTVPARQLVKGFDPGMVVLAAVWAVVALVASRAFWLFALRSYSSASS